ncbi:tRNA (N6-isopentenyl adenosine(37)-C2)-methylthiotransferase MiaB [Stratiformator vulcanicus]|uniref:tRNA-2-methylthio-N(6)-dimethylallyladenosine synthase n=1 Tax=Stratiformator vulcanicus TaxID=2527980 RepID=A0A517R0B9_9PLAN|nr:tRNA (N6-isopentenyl adenosine(37)-C2)-methylthiotransferase MiaB [Stratiformator vulcanicus]QDT37274.1 tRNA-2-methylthio-N(6)-dimethylallyladenosine synthase [Stratiformator vulcanicus]
MVSPLPTATDTTNANTADTHNRQLFIETVGCQMNVLDSELVVGALRRQGYELTDDMKSADTILFNTCSVRERAEHKIYSLLGRLKYAKRQRPGLVIGVMGCMAQKDQDIIFRRAPHVDLIAGTGQLAEIPNLIAEARQTRRRQRALSLGRRDGKRVEVADSFESYDPTREPQMRPTPHQAFVRIMIGCDKFCTYCVVPMTRGPEQSRPPTLIAAEVDILAEQGVKEVTLLGQTVNSYKHTEEGRLYRLSDLLHKIHDTPGIERIKFVTNYPRDMGSDLLEAIRDLPKCMHYLHVPLQSGCDDVLKLMKRGYTVAQYREMMDRINEIVPGCSVSSDFIVGHPGETEASFDKSIATIQEFRFKNSFIFKYSPRPGTKAFDRLADDVPEADKKRRNNELLAIQNAVSEEDNAEFIGKSVKVFVEGESKAESGKRKAEDANASPSSQDARPAIQLSGRTRCDRIVVFEGNPRLAGSSTEIAIEDCTTTTLIGSIVTHDVQHGCDVGLPILT